MHSKIQPLVGHLLSLCALAAFSLMAFACLPMESQSPEQKDELWDEEGVILHHCVLGAPESHSYQVYIGVTDIDENPIAGAKVSLTISQLGLVQLPDDGSGIPRCSSKVKASHFFQYTTGASGIITTTTPAYEWQSSADGIVAICSISKPGWTWTEDKEVIQYQERAQDEIYFATVLYPLEEQNPEQ